MIAVVAFVAVVVWLVFIDHGDDGVEPDHRRLTHSERIMLWQTTAARIDPGFWPHNPPLVDAAANTLEEMPSSPLDPGRLQ